MLSVMIRQEHAEQIDGITRMVLARGSVTGLELTWPRRFPGALEKSGGSFIRLSA